MINFEVFILFVPCEFFTVNFIELFEDMGFIFHDQLKIYLGFAKFVEQFISPIDVKSKNIKANILNE